MLAQVFSSAVDRDERLIKRTMLGPHIKYLCIKGKETSTHNLSFVQLDSVVCFIQGLNKLDANNNRKNRTPQTIAILRLLLSSCFEM